MLLSTASVLHSHHGTYQIQGQIGSDSTFGAVFKALDERGEPVVVKQLLGPAQIAEETDLEYAYVRSTFEREAKILMAHNHCQIVRGLDFIDRGDDLFLVMEFINGEDLDQVLVKRMELEPPEPFSESEAVAIGLDLCHVIHAIHQLPGQVLYRDLKPRNIMWDVVNQQIKIIDFGTARFMDRSNHSTQALGTPGYAPPEFYSTKKPLSFASDVYTIGATLFELITGELPEPLLTPVAFHGREEHLSREFRGVVRLAMAQDPRARYQTALQMAQALEKLVKPNKQSVSVPDSRNPYPFLSCLCPQCGSQPRDDKSLFCTECGAQIHVILLRIKASEGNGPPMDLYLNKQENLIGRSDGDENTFPDVDLSRYDPECYVSRQHCILKRRHTSFFVESLPTTNATLVSGYPVAPGRSVEISDGTEISLANLKVEFKTLPCVDLASAAVQIK